MARRLTLRSMLAAIDVHSRTPSFPLRARNAADEVRLEHRCVGSREDSIGNLARQVDPRSATVVDADRRHQRAVSHARRATRALLAARDRVGSFGADSGLRVGHPSPRRRGTDVRRRPRRSTRRRSGAPASRRTPPRPANRATRAPTERIVAGAEEVAPTGRVREQGCVVIGRVEVRAWLLQLILAPKYRNQIASIHPWRSGVSSRTTPGRSCASRMIPVFDCGTWPKRSGSPNAARSRSSPT